MFRTPSAWALADFLGGVGKRVGQVALTLFAASVLTFALVPLSPGSPAASILANQGRLVTAEAIAAKEHELGLDRPLVEQYVQWIGNVIHGDFGRSWKTQQPIAEMIGQRIGPTLLLGAIALVLGLLISVSVALIATRYRDQLADHVLRLVTLGIMGIPTFVLGLLVLQYVVLGLKVGRIVSDGTLGSVWLPAIVLAGVGIAGWSRPLRSLLLDALATPYARTMVARGATSWRVLVVHALPNAFVPFLGLVGLGIGGLICGAPIVESVFSWPGLGAQAIAAVRQRDVPFLQAFVLISTCGYVVGSLAADLIADLLDPRRRHRREAARS